MLTQMEGQVGDLLGVVEVKPHRGWATCLPDGDQDTFDRSRDDGADAGGEQARIADCATRSRCRFATGHKSPTVQCPHNGILAPRHRAAAMAKGCTDLSLSCSRRRLSVGGDAHWWRQRLQQEPRRKRDVPSSHQCQVSCVSGYAPMN